MDSSPPRNLRLTASHVARLVRACLDDGASVEIDGLGEFQKDGKGELKFTPYTRPMVFLAYADEDFPAALKLYEELHAAECDPGSTARNCSPARTGRDALRAPSMWPITSLRCFRAGRRTSAASFKAN